MASRSFSAETSYSPSMSTRLQYCHTCMTNEEIAMLSLRLPADIESRLEFLARQTGRTKSYYAREAILEKIEDLEDAYLGEQVLERIRKGEEMVLSAEEMWRDLED